MLNNFMGTGKSIIGYTSFPYYDSDIFSFANLISEKLDADIEVKVEECYDKYEMFKEWSFKTNNNKSNTYYLSVELREGLTDIQLGKPSYTLKVPIDYEFEDSIEISIYQNNYCHFYHLTFEHLWITLVGFLKFEYGLDKRKNILERYEILRNQYRLLMKKLSIKAIFITTWAYYNFERLDRDDLFPNVEFEDFLTMAKVEDSLLIEDLGRVIIAKSRNDLSEEFLKTDALKIAFVDKV